MSSSVCGYIRAGQQKYNTCGEAWIFQDLQVTTWVKIKAGRAEKTSQSQRNSSANSEKEKRKGKAGKTCHDDRAKISS